MTMRQIVTTLIFIAVGSVGRGGIAEARGRGTGGDSGSCNSGGLYGAA